MSNKKIKVGSVQINNGFSDNFYMPYSIGLLQAYVLHNSKDPSRYEFQTTIYKRLLLDQCVSKLYDQDIVLFSTYVWNLNISLAIAKKLKSLKENVLIIFGGPSVPDKAEKFLKDNRFIDVVSHQEGERTINAILENYPSLDWRKIPGLSYLSGEEMINNPNLPRLRNFEGCPSPYTSGVFNKLMEENPDEKWIVSWETNRGCPFSCTYCDWGSAINSRVARFEIERLYKELDWFAKNKVEFIYVCDANFGMLPRDYDIVEYAGKLKQTIGYPHILSVQSTKNARERSYKVQKALFKYGLTKGINIALQSTDAHTLKAIKRDNISITDYQILQKRFAADGIPTYSDFIIGLPGDNYEKFANGVSDLIISGQHNRIQYANLSILPNAEMAQQEYIKKYELETVKAPIVNQHGSLDETPADNIFETQEFVISTKDMPKDDWIKTRTFASTSEFLYFNKILQVPSMLIYALHPNCSYKTIFEKFMNVNNEEDFPAITAVNKILKDNAVGITNGKAEFIYSDKWLQIYWPPGEFAIIQLFIKDKIKEFYKESIVLLQQIMEDKKYDLLIEEAVWFNYKLLRKPMVKGNIKFSMHYNILDFYINAFKGKKIEIKSGQYFVEIDRSKDQLMDWKDWAKKVLWFGYRKGNYLSPARELKKEIAGQN